GLVDPRVGGIGIGARRFDFGRMVHRGGDRLFQRRRLGWHGDAREQAGEDRDRPLQRHLKAVPGRTPSALNTIAAGQKPVKLAWIMLRPAKAVSAIHHGCTVSDRTIPSSTTHPANAITARSSEVASPSWTVSRLS